MSRSAVVQSRIIEDLLDTSRFVAGGLSLRVAPLDLVSVVRSAVDAHAPEAAQKNVALTFAPRLPLLRVDGDADRLRQIATNLIGNAL